jgi:hypothetical protein
MNPKRTPAERQINDPDDLPRHFRRVGDNQP